MSMEMESLVGGGGGDGGGGAGYLSLSPIRFLERAANDDGGRVSVVYGSLSYTWKETYQRSLKLASALSQLQISRGDIVAAMAPNIPALYELHFGVPMAGAVLSPLNPKLDIATLSILLEQLDAKIIFVDYQYVELIHKSLATISKSRPTELPIVISIPESEEHTTMASSTSKLPTTTKVVDYNALLSMGQTDFEVKYPNNECDPITINFTSGSTGTSKGVVYSHRATYLNSLAQIQRLDLKGRPVFLWTVDMFRCNGWCFTWAMAALGGTNICARSVTAKAIFDLVSLHRVTHFCGAPLLLNMIANAPDDHHNQTLQNPVDVIIAGVFPPRESLMKIEQLGFNIIHGYGMTEALGPVIYRPWKHKSHTKYSYEGIPEGFMVDVKDPKTMTSVPWDGNTIGEVMFKGDTLMKGYYKNPNATQDAFRGGWFRTGDIGTRHPNGYIEMKDRIKDIIVSPRDETISTLEIEAAIITHPFVNEVAVVGKSYKGFGEKACAFVNLKEGSDNVSCEEIIKFCAERLPQDMVPGWVIFGELPVNSTGKIQKFVLRKRAKSLADGHIT